MNNLTAGMVRGLKGAPASILLLLQCAQQPLANALIAAQTGYSDKSVAQGLVYLKELGAVVHVLGGWRLARPDEEQLMFELHPESDITSTSRNHSDSVTESSSGGLNNLDLKDLIQTTTTTTESESFRLVNITKCAQALISLGNIGPAGAEAAVLRAFERGDELDVILARIAASAAYSSDKPSIHSKGGYAASMVAAGYDPPLQVFEAEVQLTKPVDDQAPEQGEPAPAASLTDDQQLWALVLAGMRLEGMGAVVDNRLGGAIFASLGAGTYSLTVPLGVTADWLRLQMTKRIAAVIARVTGSPATIEFTCRTD